MQIEISDSPRRADYSKRIAFLAEDSDPSRRAPRALQREIRQACRAASFEGREKEIAADLGWTLVGLGRAPVPLWKLRRALRKALKENLRHAKGKVLIALGEGADGTALRALLTQIVLSDYSFDRYKSRRRGSVPRQATLVVSGGAVPASAYRALAHEAQVVSEAVCWARDLGNAPANDLGPAEFAREVRRMVRGRKLSLRSLGKREIEREKMGGLLGVNAGSARPPLLLIGDYRPPRAAKTVALVGKGITFDSGGISLKPAASMGEMKYDMMGAATVFACLRAACDLALPVRVVALAPLTENLPSGTATRPGDILRMRNGKTVEVDNTDAEGRLVLGDALSYAEKFRPDLMIDFATLTGAVLVALGHECAGLMTGDERLARDLIAAGERTGEPLWRLPLWDQYREYLKSEWADMKNSAGRSGGTVTAAAFLKEFVPPGIPWAHIDFAGTAHLEKEHGGYDPGATGFGIALTIEFLKDRFGR
jgi:leucyl aminopeptidase